MLAGRAGIEVVIIDQERPEDNPCQLVREIRGAHPQLPILVTMSGQPAEIGTELVRAGATDFISKPLERDRIVQSLRLATEREATPGDLRPLSEELRIPQRFEDMIGTDRDFRKALARAAKAARSQRHVIVQGEIGTGKDMLLRAMHSASPRAGSRLEILRVRSHSGAALDSELFGHAAGAFPGAFGHKVGAIERSDGVMSEQLGIECRSRMRADPKDFEARARTRRSGMHGPQEYVLARADFPMHDHVTLASRRLCGPGKRLAEIAV